MQYGSWTQNLQLKKKTHFNDRNYVVAQCKNNNYKTKHNNTQTKLTICNVHCLFSYIIGQCLVYYFVYISFVPKGTGPYW